MEKSCVKEKQRKNSQERRRINDLPDPLLCHILSYLSTKDSVRSSCLSKRWRSLWLQVPVLDLDSAQFDDDGFDFMNFVARFLESDKKLVLNRFKLIYYYEDDIFTSDDCFFESCMDAVVSRRVRHIDFQSKSDYNELVCMPLCLYSCNTLVSLSLYHVVLSDLEPGSVISLPCLKVMHLDMVRYDETILKTLISSCPVLEKLSIIRDPFELLECIVVCSLSLKSFTLEIESSQVVVDHHAVEIDAPRLEQLSLRDHLSESIVIHNIAPSAVVHIDVDFGEEYCYTSVEDDSKRTMILNFLTGISTVSDMKISSATLEVIDDYYDKLVLLPQFSNLSWLHASFPETCLEFLPTFLGCCPNLHTLVLEIKFEIQAWPIKLSYVPPCLVSSLKYVQLWTPVATNTSNQMKLARYFLRNCAALKKLTLSDSFLEIIKVIKKVQRKSKRCNIVIA